MTLKQSILDILEDLLFGEKHGQKPCRDSECKSCTGGFCSSKSGISGSNGGSGNLCVRAHSQNGFNYPWLKPFYGRVVDVKYEEPAGSGNWRVYTDRVWAAHCRVVSHNPKNLVQQHVKAFVDPDTRFARLMFTFSKNGRRYSREPDAHFYELERDWFKKA